MKSILLYGYDAPDAISDDIDQRLTKAKLTLGRKFWYLYFGRFIKLF